MTTITDLKQAHRATWAAGNYAAVAERIDEVPPAHLLGRVPVAPGDAVLDVAAGTGNVTIRAAHAGAAVVGLDLTPELFGVARRRAEHAGVRADWVEGDAEALPFSDASFDVVLSVFGVQFAPRHQVAAHELARVCRTGGRIGLVNWTPEGFIGQFFRVMSRYLPALPDYASSPPLWGDEAHVRALFAGTGVELDVRPRAQPVALRLGRGPRGLLRAQLRADRQGPRAPGGRGHVGRVPPRPRRPCRAVRRGGGRRRPARPCRVPRRGGLQARSVVNAVEPAVKAL